MTEITHAEARQFLNTAADGALDTVGLAQLAVHLERCAECRAYAAELKSLESALASALRSRWDAAAPSAHLGDKVLGRVNSAAARRAFLRAAAGVAVFILLIL